MPAELRLFVKVFAQKGAEREVRAMLKHSNGALAFGDKAVLEWLTLGAKEAELHLGQATESPLVEASSQDLADLADVMFVAQTSVDEDKQWASGYRAKIIAALARLNDRFFGGGR